MNKRTKYVKPSPKGKLNEFQVFLLADELGLSLEEAFEANERGEDLRKYAAEKARDNSF